MIALSIPEVFDACGLLFGPEVEISLDFLKYLEPSGLKAAYRKKALETHPDRARALGRDEAKMGERFREAALAYEKLVPIITNKKTVFSRFQPIGQTKKEQTVVRREEAKSSFSDFFYTKDMPQRQLLFGQFLYYSGLISWNTLIKAVTWQKRQRPPIGQLALEWKMMSRSDIQQILMCREFRGKFGERAIRLGYLSRFQLMALLGKQRNLQRPIGTFFVNEGILLQREIEAVAARQKIHNRTFLMNGARSDSRYSRRS